jgi:ABC-type sulfate transport system substrate-binding protein
MPPVTVLNNSRRTGLAAQAAARFEAGGWPVRETGNFTGRIRETTLYYAPGQESAARSFARTFRGIGRVLPRFDRLPGRGLTVVLTRDFPAG